MSLKPVYTLGCLAQVLLASAAHAQYPSKPIRLLVPNAPGGGADATGRIFGGALSQALGRQVIIDNRAGAGGNIAAELTAKATPDGYTLGLANISHAVSVSLYRKLGYDLIKDLAPIALVVISSYGVTVNPALPAHSIKELIALARARPGSLNYGSSANGTYLGGALLCDMAGIKMTNVAYKGGAPALVALMSGEIEKWGKVVKATGMRVE
jgi:tripartite-type tricarboxylate transporter receptor subunit TctC